MLGFSLESAYGLFNDPTGLVLEPRAAEVLHFTGSNHWWGVWNTGVTAASGPPATPTHTENGFYDTRNVSSNILAKPVYL